MMLYNGLPSVLLGTFTALVMAILYSCSLLLGMICFGADHHRWSTWSLASGFVIAVLAFVLWRPQQQVFLDRICISENNDDLKAASMFSLATSQTRCLYCGTRRGAIGCGVYSSLLPF